MDLRWIVEADAVWLAGGMFIGTVDVMQRWAKEFMENIRILLKRNRTGADQQALYWMFNELKPVTEIQAYKPTGKYPDYWFELGFLCKESGEERFRDKFYVNTNPRL